jgi:tetrathionate reductase subunit B
LNIPKKFIAGTLYDPVKKEVVRGATCTLTGVGGTRTTITDGFGDFWFEGLEVGDYDLDITAEGFPLKKFDALSMTKDVNLGDVALA